MKSIRCTVGWVEWSGASRRPAKLNPPETVGWVECSGAERAAGQRS